ncbi:hypothetical protein ABZ770_32295 [Streptomyces sp. NPDC006654]|uniref:hypothetical protein n=1 Tax=Streptomyces sp. NPDC006654 TaxID=3156897 RepID=UPI0033FF174A
MDRSPQVAGERRRSTLPVVGRVSLFGVACLSGNGAVTPCDFPFRRLAGVGFWTAVLAAAVRIVGPTSSVPGFVEAQRRAFVSRPGASPQARACRSHSASRSLPSASATPFNCAAVS